MKRIAWAALAFLLGMGVGLGIGAQRWRLKALDSDDAVIAAVRAIGKSEVCQEQLAACEGKW